MFQSSLQTVKALRNRFKAGCIVLCYHRVSDLTDDHWQNAVSVRNFRDHVALLSARYQVTTIGWLADALTAGTPPARKCVVITFDDGYAVNTEAASDILTAARVPATFYLNTAWLDRDLFWWDEIVERAKADSRDASEIESRRTRFKHLEDSARETDLRNVRQMRRIPPRPDLAPMTAAHLRAVAAESLFTVGAHTHSHPSLGQIAPERQRAEIAVNKRVLEDICGREVTHFSYPFGGPMDFDDTTVSEVRAAGFASAATTSAMPQRWPGDPYRIPRVSVKNWNARKLATKLDQVWSA